MLLLLLTSAPSSGGPGVIIRQRTATVDLGGGLAWVNGGVGVALSDLGTDGVLWWAPIGGTPSGATGTATVSIPVPTVSATGNVPLSGTGAVQIPLVTTAASGTVVTNDVTGTAAVTVPLLTVSATGTVTPNDRTGTGAVTIPVPTVDATGTNVNNNVTGTAALTIPIQVVFAFSGGTTGRLAGDMFISPRHITPLVLHQGRRTT